MIRVTSPMDMMVMRDDAVDDGVVGRLDGSKQQRPDTGISEDDFDNDLTGDDKSQGEAEGRVLGQKGVAHRVAQEDGWSSQPVRLRQGDVVLPDSTHHHAAHAQGPEPHRLQNDRQCRQGGVVQDIEDKVEPEYGDRPR